jgi:hypothetical protein
MPKRGGFGTWIPAYAGMNGVCCLVFWTLSCHALACILRLIDHLQQCAQDFLDALP